MGNQGQSQDQFGIKNFTDYRIFLVAHAQEMKSKDPRWTYGRFARKLGLKTTSSITKVIRGERAPGQLITRGLIQYFRFSASEAQYFQDLIALQKIKSDPKLSSVLIAKMQRLHTDDEFRVLEENSFEVVSRWYCFALREMAQMDSFLEDPRWVARQFNFKITPREVSQGIQLLLDLHLLERDPGGRLRVCDGKISTTTDIRSEAIKRHHEQMLGHASAAIRQFEVGDREITGTTFVMRADQMNQAKEMIREFRQLFAKKFEDRSGDQVAQFQMQLFPLTRKKGKEIR